MEKLKARIPKALSLPPKWLNTYNNFVTSNRTSVTQIESAMRSLTYILPSHIPFHSSTSSSSNNTEIVSEALLSSIQLLSLYHDTLLLRTSPPSSRHHAMGESTPHRRYTLFWYQKSKSYTKIARLLAIIQCTQLLWEMAAKRKGEKVRWKVVVVLEVIKAICRILLLRITSMRPLVTPILPEREILPENEEVGETAGEGILEDSFAMDNSSTISSRKKKPYQMPRTGLTLPSLPNPRDIPNYLLSKVLHAEDIKTPSLLLPRARTTSAQVAEYLHILAPVIYAFALATSYSHGQKDGRNGKKNWQPWLLGLSIEYAAWQLRRDSASALSGGVFGGSRAAGMTKLEKEEWSKRGWAMGWWMMKGAFYEKVMKGILMGVRDRSPGLVRGVMDDYLWLWEGFYFSTARD